MVRTPDPIGLSKRTPADARPGALDLSCFYFPEDQEPASPPYPSTAYAKSVSDREGLNRNRLAAILLKQADDICTSEKALLLMRQAEVNGWLSIATTGLSTASTIVGGDLAKSILSGGAALTSGSRDHVNTHVYRNQMIQTVTKAIDTERIRLLEKMELNFKHNTDIYSVDDMIRQVNVYHQACSFGTGLQIVMDSVEKRQEFDRMDKMQRLDDQIRQLQDDQLRGVAIADIDTEIATLRKERIRSATGVTVD